MRFFRPLGSFGILRREQPEQFSSELSGLEYRPAQPDRNEASKRDSRDDNSESDGSILCVQRFENNNGNEHSHQPSDDDGEQRGECRSDERGPWFITCLRRCVRSLSHALAK